MWTYRAHLIRIVDGDTIDVDVDLGFYITRRQRVRLAGINAPEIRGRERPAGLAADKWLTDYLSDADHLVIRTEKVSDSFGRWVAWVWHGDGYVEDDPLPLSVNHLMVEAGHAVWKDYG